MGHYCTRLGRRSTDRCLSCGAPPAEAGALGVTQQDGSVHGYREPALALLVARARGLPVVIADGQGTWRPWKKADR
jgi:hypothetical protein